MHIYPTYHTHFIPVTEIYHNIPTFSAIPLNEKTKMELLKAFVLDTAHNRFSVAKLETRYGTKPTDSTLTLLKLGFSQYRNPESEWLYLKSVLPNEIASLLTKDGVSKLTVVSLDIIKRKKSFFIAATYPRIHVDNRLQTYASFVEKLVAFIAKDQKRSPSDVLGAVNKLTYLELIKGDVYQLIKKELGNVVSKHPRRQDSGK